MDSTPPLHGSLWLINSGQANREQGKHRKGNCHEWNVFLFYLVSRFLEKLNSIFLLLDSPTPSSSAFQTALLHPTESPPLDDSNFMYSRVACRENMSKLGAYDLSCAGRVSHIQYSTKRILVTKPALGGSRGSSVIKGSERGISLLTLNWLRKRNLYSRGWIRPGEQHAGDEADWRS